MNDKKIRYIYNPKKISLYKYKDTVVDEPSHGYGYTCFMDIVTKKFHVIDDACGYLFSKIIKNKFATIIKPRWDVEELRWCKINTVDRLLRGKSL